MPSSAGETCGHETTGNGPSATAADAEEEGLLQHARQQAQSERRLGSLCSSLHAAAATANNDLREYLLAHPHQRPSVIPLSCELTELQTTTRLYIRRCSVADATAGGNTTNTLPQPLLGCLITVVHQAAQTVSDVLNLLEDSTAVTAARGPDNTSPEGLTLRLAKVVAAASICTAALNLGLDAMALAPSLQPAGEEVETSELPGYQTSQLLQDTLSVRLRVTALNSAGESVQPDSLPSISDFLDQLQRHLDQGSNSLLVPPITEPYAETAALPSRLAYHRSGRSSLQSDLPHGSGLLQSGPNETAYSGQQSPAYDSVRVEHPAPSTISLHHVSRKPAMDAEIVSVAFVTKRGELYVTANTMTGPTKFYPLRGANQFLSPYTGGYMMFPPETSASTSWAYVAEDDLGSSGAGPSLWQHDGSDFRRPILCIGDYTTGKRHQKLRWWGIRPLCFSPDGQRLAVTGNRHRIAFLDAAHQYGLRPDEDVITSHTDTITHALFTPDSHALVSLSRDGTIRLTDPLNMEPLSKLDTGTWKKPALLGVTPDSNVVVSVWGDLVYRWNHATGAVDSYALGSRRACEGWPVALSPDCRFLLCRTGKGVDISDAHTGRVLFTVYLSRGFLTAAAFSADSTYLALGKAASNIGLRVHQATLDIWRLEF